MTAAVIVAAGRGVRMGGHQPKALRLLHGQPMFSYSVREALACSQIERVVVVVPGDELDALEANGSDLSPHIRFVAGGASRQQSVLRGIESAGSEADWVAVHDAARPLVTSALFSEVISLARKHGGAVAAHPATDTIRRRNADGSFVTLPRTELWHAETPQVFPREALEQALLHCEKEGVTVTDEAEAMELQGRTPAMYHNPSANPKISTDADWQLVEHLLRSRTAALR